MTNNESIAVPPLVGNTVGLRRAFREARPFGHVVLDGFLAPDLFAALTGELRGLGRSAGGPGYDWRLIARDLRRRGPACAAVEDRLRSAEFLSWAQAVSGEDDLALNPAGNCGGLFRDGHGSELEPRRDANCNVPGRRRRATLILYLHPRWRPEWGGRLELFADPAAPAVKEIEPAPNRAVLLASHARSWHGIAPISLPPAARAVGRRALILNFYAPGREPRHLNTWMPRPIPARLRPGRVLTRADERTLRLLRERRLARLRELQTLELAVAPGARPAPAPELPASLRPGRALTAGDARGVKAALGALDAELSRLYRVEHAYRARLDRRGAR